MGCVLVPGNALNHSQGSEPPRMTRVRQLLQPFVCGEHAVPPVLGILCAAHQAAKIAKATNPPHVTQKRRIEGIMPLIEKGGTQETLWYIYIFFF